MMKPTEPKKTDNRGGRREGAGRPKTDSKLFTFRAPGAVAQVIEAQGNRTEFILDCISHRIQNPSVPAVERVPDFGEVHRITDVKDLRLPFFDQRVVAGFPIPLDNDERGQDIELLQMLCPHPEASYLIRVKGDSMIEADIHDGDILIVDKSNRSPSSHEPAVCELNGEYTIKYVHQREGRGVLVPANPNYPEIPISEGDDFSVWGVVTYIIHRPQLGNS